MHAALFATVVAAVAVSPALPPRWIPGAPASPLAPAPVVSSAAERLHEMILGPARRPTALVPLRLEDVPTVEVLPRPVESHPPTTSPPGRLSTAIYVSPGCTRASVRNHVFGHISVGGRELPIGPQSDGGVDLYGVKGGDGQHTYTLAEWETLEPGADGALRYEQTIAWFDMLTCKAYEVQTITTPVRALAGGLGFLFRTSCPACADPNREKLHVLFPEPQGPFRHSEVKLQRGSAATAEGRVTLNGMHELEKIGLTLGRKVDAQVRIEIAQGMGEAAPTALLFVGDAPAAE